MWRAVRRTRATGHLSLLCQPLPLETIRLLLILCFAITSGVRQVAMLTLIILGSVIMLKGILSLLTR
jgi:hypothetical protein